MRRNSDFETPLGLKHAYEKLTPDDATKDRMYQQILQQAQLAQQKSAPDTVEKPVWYVRYKMPLGVAATASVCAALLLTMVGNPVLQQHSEQRQQLLQTASVTQMTTTTAVTTAEHIAIETQPHSELVTTVAVGKTEAAPAVTTTHAAIRKSAETMSSAVQTTAVSTSAEPIMTTTQTIWMTTEPEYLVTVPVVTTPEPPMVTTQTSVQTEEVGVETEFVTTAASVPAEPEVSTESGVSSPVTFYGNMYDFYQPMWSMHPYYTQFEPIEECNVGDYLGSSAAYDKDRNCHTILVYALEDVPVEDAIVVQYADEFNYYIAYRAW